MPDTKFSWPMLKEHLRRYLWIYLIGIVICLAGASLLWTTTRPRLSNEETVIVYLVSDYAGAERLDGVAADMLARGQAEDEQLKDVEFQWLQYDDEDYTSAMLLMTRLVGGDGDAFIANGDGLAALSQSGSLLPLEDIVAEGWLAEYGLEPYYAEIEDEDTGEVTRYMAGLRLDDMENLAHWGVMNPQGSALCLSVTSQNPETTRRVLEFLVEDLAKEAEDAGTEG